MKKKPVDKFITKENQKITKMNQLVADAIANNESIIQTLLEANTTKLSVGQRMADNVASFG
ncbi:MAG: hypothetical protein WCJ39_05410 [bacterium]